MFSILQRYTFESNSQPIPYHCYYSLCCFLSCKDTHLKAIHNGSWRTRARLVVVFYLAKIHIWKQFTTRKNRVIAAVWLFSILQRYTFESNSQLNFKRYDYGKGCFLSCKDTHLKAIHNAKSKAVPAALVVFYLAKIHIWKQFTTWYIIIIVTNLLFSILQRYTFESNSQLV